MTGLSASSVLQFSTSVMYDIGFWTPEDPCVSSCITCQIAKLAVTCRPHVSSKLEKSRQILYTVMELENEGHVNYINFFFFWDGSGSLGVWVSLLAQ